MRKEDRHTIGFALAVCVVCSLLLSSATAMLRERQDRIAEWARQMNVLRAFGADLAGPDGRRLPMETIGGIFEDRVEAVQVDARSGEIVETPPPTADEVPSDRLPLYRWREEGEVTRYAFPIGGPGLWAPIRGYLAVERDGMTIAGITFYEHGETPGLGGEIESDRFQERFQGLPFFADGELQRVLIVKGTVRDRYPDGHDHAVDGISGATLTGRAVTEFLNEAIRRYDVFFRTIRGP